MKIDGFCMISINRLLIRFSTTTRPINLKRRSRYNLAPCAAWTMETYHIFLQRVLSSKKALSSPTRRKISLSIAQQRLNFSLRDPEHHPTHPPLSGDSEQRTLYSPQILNAASLTQGCSKCPSHPPSLL